MNYRDDREALRQQLEALRAEVESLRATSGDDNEVAERVNVLSREVATALERMNEDREVLQKLATSLAALKKVDARTTSDEVATPNAGATPPAASPVSWRPVLFIVGAAMLVGIVVMIARSEGPTSGAADPLRDIPGAPNAVDPLALLPRAEGLAAAGSSLTAIDAWYVSDTGTLDFTAKGYTPRVSFSFMGPPPAAPPADSTLPIGAPRPFVMPPETPCFELDREGLKKGCSGIGSHRSRSIPKPTCSMREVWAAAKGAGAPAGAVAHIKYEPAILGKRISWTFEIDAPGHTYSYEIADPGCQIVKNKFGFD